MMKVNTEDTDNPFEKGFALYPFNSVKKKCQIGFKVWLDLF